MRILLDKIHRKIYYTDFTDTIIASTEGEPIYGSITTLFKDDMVTARRIMEVVADIKRNSEETA